MIEYRQNWGKKTNKILSNPKTIRSNQLKLGNNQQTLVKPNTSYEKESETRNGAHWNTLEPSKTSKNPLEPIRT